MTGAAAPSIAQEMPPKAMLLADTASVAATTALFNARSALAR